jgi:hypothetical protein
MQAIYNILQVFAAGVGGRVRSASAPFCENCRRRHQASSLFIREHQRYDENAEYASCIETTVSYSNIIIPYLTCAS